MNDTPLVTVVTPSYNQGRFIEETILSVLSQDYPHIEYLVIDGGSTDNTLDILRKYEDRLTWLSEPDRGQSHAINKGFRAGRGEILCWLNSDDTYEPGAVGRAVKSLNSQPDVMMISGGANFIDEAGNVLEIMKASMPFDLWSVVYLAQSIHQPASFFRRNIFNSIGLVNEKLHWIMDWELWVRIGCRFKVVCVDDVFANMRVYPEAKTYSGGLRRLREIVSVQREYYGNRSLLYGLLKLGSGSIHMQLKVNYPHLYRYLKRLIFSLKNSSLDSLHLNYHGVYPDQWLGRRARFMFRQEPESCAVILMLDLPDDTRLFPNQVKVKANGHCLTVKEMPVSGRYEVQVPYDAHAVKPTEIELRFAKSLPRDEHRRRLACKLIEVRYSR